MMSLVSTPLSVARVAAPKKAIRKTVTAKASAADAAKSAAVAGETSFLRSGEQKALRLRPPRSVDARLGAVGPSWLWRCARRALLRSVRRPQRAIDHPMAGVVTGVASGVLCGALNEGAVPVVIYLAQRGWLKHDVKATLQFYFVYLGLLSVCTLGYEGLLTRRHLYFDVVGLPAAVAGINLGVCVCRSRVCK